MAGLKPGLLATVITIALCSSPGARANEVADDGSEEAEEILVTAQKREQLLKDVPLSVAAITGEALAEHDISSVTELQKMVPNFYYLGSNNPRSSGVFIRGIGTISFSPAIEGAVGIVVDGVPIGRQGAGFSDFFDVARLEILRGPQGTLFGKNASAGLINITTRDPTDDFEVETALTAGEGQEVEFRGSLSGPLAPTLLARASGFRIRRDGHIRNVATGERLNGQDEWGGRLKLTWEPAAGAKFLLSGDYTERNADCCIWTINSFGTNQALRNEATAAGIVPGLRNRKVNVRGDVFIREKIYGTALTALIELPANLLLTSITGYRGWDAIDNGDGDQRTAQILDLNTGDSRQKQFTQELRLSAARPKAVDWVAGFFYFAQDYDLQTTQLGTFNLPVPPNTRSRRITVRNDTGNVAVFGDAIWRLNERITVFGGVRYTAETLETDYVRAALPGTLPVIQPLADHARRKDNAWSWRGGLQLRPSGNVMVYGSIARGYKGGGYNALVDSAFLRTVEPEVPTAYEIGLKSTLFNQALRFNLAAFRTDFKDFQAQAISVDSQSGILLFDIVNAGSLRTQGIEADFSLRLARDLKLEGGFAYTDADYTRFTTAPCFSGQTVAQGCTGAGPAARQDLTGRPLANAPKVTANGSVRYETPVSGATRLFGQLFYAWRGGSHTAIDLDPRSYQKGYGLLDAQMGLTFDRDIRAWLWGKNLTAEHFAEVIFDTPFDSNGQSQFIPASALRRFGVTVEARF